MKRKWKILLSISIIVTVLMIAYLFASSYSIYRPIPFNNLAMSRAVQWVQANQGASRDGAISLPPNMASVSVTSKAYVTNGIIFFPRWVGRKTLLPDPFNSDADWEEGYGFSTSSLPTEASEPAGSTKFFCMMNLSNTPDTNPNNGREMAISDCIEKHWYGIDSFS